jgi:hypothetical protein
VAAVVGLAAVNVERLQAWPAVLGPAEAVEWWTGVRKGRDIYMKMKFIGTIAAAVLAAIALAGCASGISGTDTSQQLSVTCSIHPVDVNFGTQDQLTVIIAQSAADPSVGPVYVHTINLTFNVWSANSWTDKTITEKVDRTVPGSDTSGWGNGITITYPVPTFGGSNPNGCWSGGSWS